MYQLYIRNASVIDGSGNPAYSSDIAVKDGKICLHPDPALGSEQVIDATGLVLSPGFIDAHSHGDMLLGDKDCALSRVSQGMATECTGQCGESMFPVSEDPEKRNMFASCTASYLKASPRPALFLPPLAAAAPVLPCLSAGQSARLLSE